MLRCIFPSLARLILLALETVLPPSTTVAPYYILSELKEEPKRMQDWSCELTEGTQWCDDVFLFLSFPARLPPRSRCDLAAGVKPCKDLRVPALLGTPEGLSHLTGLFLLLGRCKECSSTLLPGSYKPGSEAGTFVCTHHRGKLAVSGKMDRRASPERQSPELRTEIAAGSVGEDGLPAGAEVGKDNSTAVENVAETQMPAERPASPEEKDSTSSKAQTATPHAGSATPTSQTPPRPPLPSKPSAPSQDKASPLDARLRDTRPTPAPRRSTDASALSPAASHPVPRPRSTVQGEGSDCAPGLVNGERAWCRFVHQFPSFSAAWRPSACR